MPCKKGYLDHNSKIISLGSCFSDEIGAKLLKDQFQIDVNPAGIFFNPESVLNLLNQSLINQVDKNHFVERDGTWLSYDFHSEVTGKSEQDLMSKINSINLELANSLKSCTHIFVTFGTAWAHNLIKTDSIVANCHKTVSSEFKKVLLSKDSLFAKWKQMLSGLIQGNPGISILLTVSPVRHSKDGLRENNISKGLLHQLVHDLENQFEQVDYFPAYEILIDELRDYRFYAEDLVHPSRIAVDYIYDKFKAVYFSDDTTDIVKLCDKLRNARQHKFMNASTTQMKQHKELIRKLEDQIKKMRS